MYIRSPSSSPLIQETDDTEKEKKACTRRHQRDSTCKTDMKVTVIDNFNSNSRKEVFFLTVDLSMKLRSSCVKNTAFSRKEVFQPHLPVRLPCYDLAPITGFALGRSSRSRTSGAPGFHGLTGGVYKARERIHRAMADARLLANPASWGRVADPNPN